MSYERKKNRSVININIQIVLKTLTHRTCHAVKNSTLMVFCILSYTHSYFTEFSEISIFPLMNLKPVYTFSPCLLSGDSSGQHQHFYYSVYIK